MTPKPPSIPAGEDEDAGDQEEAARVAAEEKAARLAAEERAWPLKSVSTLKEYKDIKSVGASTLKEYQVCIYVYVYMCVCVFIEI